MDCSSCGAPAQGEARFCGSCGAPTAPAAVTTLVPPAAEPAVASASSVPGGPVLKLGERVVAARSVPAGDGGPAVPAGSTGTVVSREDGADGALYDVEFIVDGVPAMRQVPGDVVGATSVPQQAASVPQQPAPLGEPPRPPRAVEPIHPATVSSTAPHPGGYPFPTSSTGPAEPEFKGLKVLIPFVLYKMLFSLRRPLTIKTSLGVDRLHQLFAEQLAGQSTLNKLVGMASSYTRNVTWRVSRTSAHESTATCHPKDLVSWSAGRWKRYCDVSGDQIELVTDVRPDGSVIARIGPGVYTTVYGVLFAFPAMLVYARLAVKAWHKEDPELLISYPLSRSRIVGWVAFVLLFLSIVA